MHNDPTITLHYVQKDGAREETKLTHHTMDEARKVAKAVLHIGNGRYKEVDICAEDGTVETIQNPAAPCTLTKYFLLRTTPEMHFLLDKPC
jgi:hypothetical protein